MHACLAVGVRAQYMRLSELEAVPGGSWSPIAGKFLFAHGLFAVSGGERENKGQFSGCEVGPSCLSKVCRQGGQ